MYESIDKKEAKKIVDNCQWILKKDVELRNDDGEGEFIDAFYSRSQHYGATDYKDHRKDSIEKLKKIMKEGIINGRHQRLQFYKNMNMESPYTKILCYGYYGGYTSYFID